MKFPFLNIPGWRLTRDIWVIGSSTFPSYIIETVSGSNELEHIALQSLQQHLQQMEHLFTVHEQIKSPNPHAVHVFHIRWFSKFHVQKLTLKNLQNAAHLKIKHTLRNLELMSNDSRGRKIINSLYT